MLIDTHSHLSFKAYDKDRGEVVKRTQKEGVVCIDVGTKYETSKNVVELAEKNEGIYAAIGLHPIHVKDENFDKQKYKKLALSHKFTPSGKRGVVAIGEIGLDDKYPNPGQKDIFVQQLDLAKELNLPVIVHCRMAHTDVLDILKSEARNPKSEIRGVVHCFTGNWEEAQKYLNLGFYIGINGIIFSPFGRSPVGGKLSLEDVVKLIPLDKILVETDCPYLTPSEAGPKEMRNEPIFVKYVAKKIAEQKGITFDEVASATTTNAKKIFKI